MSIQSGIGNLQQLFTQLDPGGAASASAAARAGQLARGGQASTAPAASGTSADHDVDQASLSSTGGLAAQAAQAPDVRTEKVAALQQSIAAGTYNVSSSDVADKIIGALLGPRLGS